MRPNFKTLGPRWGREIKEVVNEIITATMDKAIDLQINKVISLRGYLIDINDVEFSPLEIKAYKRHMVLNKLGI